MNKFINRMIDLPKLFKTVWLMLWVMLFILLILKFCFGMWYPIIVKNELFIKFNEFITGNWLKYLVLIIFYIISLNVMCLISYKKFMYDKIYEPIIVNILIILSFFVKMKFGNFCFIIDVVYLIIMPIIDLLKRYPKGNKAKIILYPVIAQLLIMLFQLNILLVRNLDTEKINNEYFVLGFVLQLDYYIFLIITWLGVTKMGLWSGWFFGKDVTVLEAEKAKELAKANPNMEKVAELDKHIEELKEEK